MPKFTFTLAAFRAFVEAKPPAEEYPAYDGNCALGQFLTATYPGYRWTPGWTSGRGSSYGVEQNEVAEAEFAGLTLLGNYETQLWAAIADAGDLERTKPPSERDYTFGALATRLASIEEPVNA